MKKAAFAVGLSLACASSVAAQEATVSPDVARAAFINASGEPIGTATLVEMPNGVLIQARLANIPEGPHGFHIHETRSCNVDDAFKSAGGHFAPDGNEHGFAVENGPHAGDLANQTAMADGTMIVETFAANLSLTEGDHALLDDDGSALVVHSTADDYRSQPSGASGDRIACGVIEQQ
ncbi:superoxide dismutase family protein [Peteryoungia desertarenae]|uniref:Superoxide dismutase family protein n=1 Tax=Peteryoungia desertarenae TaxID=1813451 RepID=A0ABX6QJM8_9HYPH|nr:superoxide dismutase family protein [Peteryoungia desertarenae]QLF68445.1 superoxide dismutase family protein [Peteryoungia desertarenae]